MDSFIGLFDPSDSMTERKKEKKTDQSQLAFQNGGQSVPTVQTSNKSETKADKRRRGKHKSRNSQVHEESSFLCEPDISNELLSKDSSYIDSFLESSPELKNVRRKSSGRRGRRRRNKVSPFNEEQLTAWNNINIGLSNNFDKNVGKNVNNLNDGEPDQSEDETKMWDDVISNGDTDDMYCSLNDIGIKDDPVFGSSEFEQLNCDSCFYSENTDNDESSTGNSDDDDACYGYLPPEPQLGNVEYKLKLLNPSEQRFQHLVTQLKWRMVSGGGVATYVLGVSDNGSIRGLRPSSLRKSVWTLAKMSRYVGASLQVNAKKISERRAVAELVIRKMTDIRKSVEVRVAMLGANEAGKSTLIGVLTQGELDNGRGSARLNMFRHLHEVRSGRTSSLSHEILGFDAQGCVVNYGCSELMTAARIDAKSSKLISFIDLAGHSKYQRTTLFGLLLYSPQYVTIAISATAGVNKMTEEHLSLILALELPFIIVITKIDLVTDGVQSLVGDIQSLFNTLEYKKKAHVVVTCEECTEVMSDARGDLVCIFPVSCVSGQGLKVLNEALQTITTTRSTNDNFNNEPTEFQIDEIFRVGQDVSPIVGGLQVSGTMREGDRLLIGPLDSGDFVPITIRTIYRNRVPCNTIMSGQSASLGLSHHPPILRQGMVIIAVPEDYKPRVFKHANECGYAQYVSSNKGTSKKKLFKREKRSKAIDTDGECQFVSSGDSESVKRGDSGFVRSDDSELDRSGDGYTSENDHCIKSGGSKDENYYMTRFVKSDDTQDGGSIDTNGDNNCVAKHKTEQAGNVYIGGYGVKLMDGDNMNSDVDYINADFGMDKSDENFDSMKSPRRSEAGEDQNFESIAGTKRETDVDGKSDQNFESIVETQREPDVEGKSDQNFESIVETQREPDVDENSEQNFESIVETQREPDVDGKSDQNFESIVETQREPDVDGKSDQNFESIVETQREPDVEGKSDQNFESIVETQREPDVDGKSDQNFESIVETQREPDVDGKSDQNFESIVETQREPDVDGKSDQNFESIVETQREPDVDGKSDQNFESIVETQREPDVGGKSDQNFESRVEIRQEFVFNRNLDQNFESLGKISSESCSEEYSGAESVNSSEKRHKCQRKISKVTKFSKRDVNVFSRSDSDGEFQDRCSCSQLLPEDATDPRGCKFFQAHVKVLRHSQTIHRGVQVTVYIGNIRQSAIVEGVMCRNNAIRSGESGSAVLRFCRQPEYVKTRRTVLIRAGPGTTAVGSITQVFPYLEP